MASYQDTASMSRLEGGPERVRWMLSEEAEAQRTGAVTGMGDYRAAVSPVMKAVDEAEAALDMAAAAAAAGGGGAGGCYEGAREAAAAAYEKAGLTDAANFLRAAA